LILIRIITRTFRKAFIPCQKSQQKVSTFAPETCFASDSFSMFVFVKNRLLKKGFLSCTKQCHPQSPQTGDASQSTFLGRSNLDPHLISSADLQLFGVDLAQLLLKNHVLGINRDLLDIHWGLSQQGYSCFFFVQRFNCLVSVHLQPPRLQRRDVRHRAGHVSFAAAWHSFDATPRLPEA